MLMMLPGRPSRRHCWMANLLTAQTPFRLVSTTALQSSSLRVSVAPSRLMPALLTTTSRAGMRSKAASTLAWSATFMGTTTASRPRARTAPAVSSSFSTRRAASTRSAPCSASTRAKWAPKPLDAPVIRIRLPLTSNRFSLMGVSLSGGGIGKKSKTLTPGGAALKRPRRAPAAVG